MIGVVSAVAGPERFLPALQRQSGLLMELRRLEFTHGRFLPSSSLSPLPPLPIDMAIGKIEGHIGGHAVGGEAAVMVATSHDAGTPLHPPLPTAPAAPAPDGDAHGKRP